MEVSCLELLVGASKHKLSIPSRVSHDGRFWPLLSLFRNARRQFHSFDFLLQWWFGSNRDLSSIAGVHRLPLSRFNDRALHFLSLKLALLSALTEFSNVFFGKIVTFNEVFFSMCTWGFPHHIHSTWSAHWSLSTKNTLGFWMNKILEHR